MPMQTVWQRLVRASSASVGEFQRVYFQPEAEHAKTVFVSRPDQYAYLWAWYESSALEDVQLWGNYRSKYKLYKNTRIIRNPVRRLVDFYVDNMYPGILAADLEGIPPGVPLAVPFPKDTDPRLKRAIAQIWEWSRWADGKSIMVQNAAALGNAFVEIVDVPSRGKVFLINRWPGQVVELELDEVGNVRKYALEYMAQDEDGKPYRFRKEVDQLAFRTYRDDKIFDYDPNDGLPGEYENPYGFCPAVWVPHRNMGGMHGAPAIYGSLGKLEELNSELALVHDQVKKVVAAPKGIWTPATAEELFDNIKKGTAAQLNPVTGERESLLFLIGPEGTEVDDLAGDLDFGGAMEVIKSLVEEIEEDHPELRVYEELRRMSQVTGPAAFRLIGDVSNKVFRIANGYDRASRQLFQMSVAIAGFNLATGRWPNPTPAQAKFDGYDLDSYANGDLDFEILPRPLLQPTSMEFAQEEVQLWSAAAQAVKNAGQAFPAVARHWGWPEDKIAMFQQERESEAEVALERMKANQEVMAASMTNRNPAPGEEPETEEGSDGNAEDTN